VIGSLGRNWIAVVSAMSSCVGEIVEPAGRAPSRWAGSEMLDLLRVLERHTVLATGDEEGVTAELAFEHDTALVRFQTHERHPSVGHGLLVTMRLPWVVEKDAHPLCNQLNLFEVADRPLSNFRGAWCVSPSGDVTFAAFYPNLTFARGAAINLAMYLDQRAEWISSWRDPRPRDERRRTAVPAIFRLLSQDR
jgi:hypothetical protein